MKKTMTTFNALLLSGLALVSAPAFSAVSTFDVDSDGWVADTLGDTTGPLSWLATGGVPDGHVLIGDIATGEDNYFVAPGKFLGNQSSFLNGNLSFDVKTQPKYDDLTSYFAPDVILSGNGLTAVFATGSNPVENVWTSYNIPLAASSWKLNSLTGDAVTESDFASILANLTVLKIRGEFWYGPETAYLDNVKMSAVPVPPAFALFATGLIAWFGGLKRKHSA